MRKAEAALLATGLVALLNTLPPLTLVPGDRPSQAAKCLFGRLPTVHIRTDLGKNLEGGVGVDAVNTGQINP